VRKAAEVETRVDYGDYFVDQAGSLDRPVKREFWPDTVNDEYRGRLEKIAHRCKAGPYKCVFITQPHAYSPSVQPELRQRFWMTPPNTDYTLSAEMMAHLADVYNRYLVSFAKAQGIAVCDIAPKQLWR
jgi:hypothetical protein